MEGYHHCAAESVFFHSDHRGTGHPLVVRLVVLVPLEASNDTIEETRLSRAVPITPVITARRGGKIEPFVQISKLFLALVRAEILALPLGFGTVVRFGLEVGRRRARDGLVRNAS